MGRREENKRRKREAIERAALEAFLAHGYAGASIEQIAAAAEVARGTFYLYFADKRALFDTLMDRWFDPVQGALGDVAQALAEARTAAEAREVYRGMAVGLAVLLAAHRQEVEIAFRESRQPGEAGQSLRARELAIFERVTAFTADAASRGLISVADPRLFSLIVFGAVERLMYEWLLGSPLGDPRELADDVLRPFATALGL